MSMPTYSAEQIARFFLAITDADSNDVSNLKLQKLCYYAQGVCSALRGCRLISEDLEAWDHGPVYPTLYHLYKNNKSDPIAVVQDFDFDQIDERDRKALMDIYAYYGQFSAWRLREMSHEEQPWMDAYKKDDRKINICDVISYFAPQIDEEYKNRIYN